MGATRVVAGFSMPAIFYMLMTFGAIWTLTDRSNPSVDTAWGYTIGFASAFTGFFFISLIVLLFKICRRGVSGDSKAQVVDTLWWAMLAITNFFFGGLLWWYYHNNKTNDAYQHEIALITMPYSLSGMLISFAMGIIIFIVDDGLSA